MYVHFHFYGAVNCDSILAEVEGLLHSYLIISSMLWRGRFQSMGLSLSALAAVSAVRAAPAANVSWTTYGDNASASATDSVPNAPVVGSLIECVWDIGTERVWVLG